MTDSIFVERKPSTDEPTTRRSWRASLRLTSWYSVRHDTVFCFYLIFTTIMLISPWIFFVVVRGLKGIPIQNSFAEKNPKETSYAMTAISNIIAAIMTHLFSTAVSYLAQKRIVHKGATISHVAFFAALKNRTLTFSLFRQGRYDLFILVVVYFIISISITPGITTLLTPFHYTQKVQLFGQELDFASVNVPACIDWWDNFTPPSNCDWTSYKGLHYTTCLGENQLADVLESGRGNILSLFQGNNVSITYRQFAPAGGLKFLGSTRGVLPNGPNGIPAFNTLDEASNPYFSGATTASQPSYNYTLELQGMSTEVTCKYDTESPVIAEKSRGLVRYTGSCHANQSIVTDPKIVDAVPNSDSSLGFWSCLATPSAHTGPYNLYFRGYGYYSSVITCTVTPIHPTLFSLTYTGQSDTFAVQASNSTPSPVAGSAIALVDQIQQTVLEAQNIVSNLFAESIITLGVKSFSLPPDRQDPEYLRLYQAMIQGILDYEFTYIRLLAAVYADSSQPSLSCMRSVNGSAELNKFGWSATYQTALFLLPITLVNLLTLFILFIAMFTADKGTKLLPYFDPTDTESLLLSHDESGRLLESAMAHPTDRTPWSSSIAFGKNSDGIYRLWPLNEVVST